MTIEDKIKKTKSRLKQLEAKLKLQIQEEQNYGRMALTSDEAKFTSGAYGEIFDTDSFGYFHGCMMQGRAFTAKGAAERFLKAEKLAFECRQKIAESWGKEKAYWTNATQIKHCLSLYKGNEIKIHVASVIYQQFAFKTMEDAQGFIDSHNKDDIILMLMRGDV